MDHIEEIWEKSKQQLAEDASFDSARVLEFTSKVSSGISARLIKPLWLGAGIYLLAVILFTSNFFLYAGNLSIQIPVVFLLLLSVSLTVFLLKQISAVKKMETSGRVLRTVLITKIKYLNTRYNTAMHFISLSIVFATFGLNLSLESNDGIFELKKILILSIFYLFSYLIVYGLSRLTLRAYDRQLKTALANLEENALRDTSAELAKYKRSTRIILAIIIAILLTGIITLLFYN